MKRRLVAAAMVVAVDFLLGVLLMQQAILSLTTIQTLTPHIQTYGQYAIVMSWPLDGNDVDLYTQDPQGNIAYFARLSVDEMHLEHDDLGDNETGYKGLGHNEERTILRGFSAGEYTVNAQMYSQLGRPGPTHVTIQLYSLRGQDKLIVQQTVTLHEQGDEQTAFRFTLNGAGDVVGVNHLQKHLVDPAVNQNNAGHPQRQ